MSLNYPANPLYGTLYQSGAFQWMWDGQKWASGMGAPVTSVAGRTGNVILTHSDITDWTTGACADPLLITGVGNSGQFRMTNGASGYGSFWRNDGSNTYLLLTNAGNPFGSWNTFRPIIVDNSSGRTVLGNGAAQFWTVDQQSTSMANFTPMRWRFAVYAGAEASAGSIDYRGFDTNALGIVGAGTASGNRLVHIWDNCYIDSNLTVLNGAIYVNNGGIQTNGGITASGGVSSVGSGAGLVFQERTNGNYEWQWYSLGNVARLWWNGAGDIWYTDTGGNSHQNGECYAAHSLATAGYVWVNGCQWQNAGGNMYTPNNLNTGGVVYVGNGPYWQNNGGMYSPNYVHVGDFYSHGNVNTSGTLIAAGCQWYNSGGWWTTGQPIHSGSDIQADGAMHVGGITFSNNGGWFYTGSGIYSSSIVRSDDHLDIQGTVQWYNSGGYMYTNNTLRSYGHLPRWDNDSSCGLTGNAWAQVAAYWFNNTSDARLKQDIESPPPGALACVTALAPVQYRFRQSRQEDDPLHREVTDLSHQPLHRGFLAQDVRKVMGDRFAGWQEAEGIQSISYDELTAVLWQAVAELSAKVDELGAKLAQR